MGRRPLAPHTHFDDITSTANTPEHTVTLQIRAIGPADTVDELLAAINASPLRLTRLQRGYPARETGSERAYIDVDMTASTANAEGSVA